MEQITRDEVKDLKKYFESLVAYTDKAMTDVKNTRAWVDIKDCNQVSKKMLTVCELALYALYEGELRKKLLKD